MRGISINIGEAVHDHSFLYDPLTRYYHIECCKLTALLLHSTHIFDICAQDCQKFLV